jgi:hypothetical protein
VMLTWNSKNLRNMCPSLPDRCRTCKSSSSKPKSLVAEVMLNTGTHLVVVAGVAGVTKVEEVVKVAEMAEVVVVVVVVV